MNAVNAQVARKLRSLAAAIRAESYLPHEFGVREEMEAEAARLTARADALDPPTPHRALVATAAAYAKSFEDETVLASRDGGDGDASRMGVVVATGNDEGRQVLGTCSPGRWVSIKAAVHEFLNLPMREVTEEEQQSADEQTRNTTDWVRSRRVEE